MLTTQWVLWSGTIGLERPLEDRVLAATANNFTRVSLSPLDVARANEAGWTTRDIRRLFEDASLSLVMDPVSNWYPGISSATSRFGRFTLDESMVMCAELGVASMTLLAHRDGSVDVKDMIEPFGVVCDRAADFGADVHIEFIPMTQVPDLASAWQLVSAAERSNGGLLVDAWHFYRGNPDLGLLATIPGDRVMAVQLDDGLESPIGSLWDDTRNRLLPGDGALDLDALVKVLADIGGLSWVGPEVISPEMEAMDPVEAVRIAGERTRQLIERALAA